ncbi:MAG: S8 family serine peptidase, partial [Bacteroidota bacterium]
MRKLDHNYFVIQKAGALPESSYQWPVNNQWKIAGAINKATNQGKGSYIIRSSCKTRIEANRKLDISPVKYLSNGYMVTGKLSEVMDQFLDDDCITYIGSESFEPTTDGAVLDLNLTYNKVTTVQSRYSDIDGSGFIVSVKENQYDVEDIDLLGKDLPSSLSSANVDNHATDMATIIGGRGISSVGGKGVAPKVSLTSSDFIDIVPDSDDEYERLNVFVQNHSYGTVIENFYGTLAEAYDASSYRNKDILHVFSAGNVGTSTTTEGPYQGIADVSNLTGNFKGAKNILTVGSTDTIGNVYIISSRGPTFDGRVKPELVTYSMFGTSNSAAIVSGVGVLLHQAHVENFGSTPSSALLKALLINSATDADVPGIDFKTGYGALNAERAIQNTIAGQFLTGEVTDSDVVSFDLNIPDNAVDLKVTLVWTDSAATAGSVTALVNDLDMTLSYGGDTWLPWVLDTSRQGINLPAARGADHLNNVEQVTVETPAAGDYQISITGFDVASSSQPFAIAYQYDIENQFEWSYPIAGDNVPYDGEVMPYLQWESSFPDGTTGSLGYTIDGGMTWITIRENVDLKRGFLRWADYPQNLQLSQLRMTINSTPFVSDEFTVSSPKKVSLGFDCGDSLLFLWEPDLLADSYNILNLEGTGFSMIKSTTDTSFLINKGDLSSPFIAVQPIL